MGDVGKIVSESGVSIEVIDTKKENEEIIHVISDTNIDEKAEYNLIVDPQKRMNSSSNHTATHLLHQALRNILGLHVEQKGSLVNSDYLRFDFSYNKKLESNQILEVENFVNNRINESLELEENRKENYDNAIKKGVVALFGEKYGDKVRSIKFGDSYELCGGTHVKNTLSLRVFKILSEGSVASGIRRIEAISGYNAVEFLRKNSIELSKIGQLTSSKSNIFEGVKSIQNEKKSLEKLTKNLESKILSNTFSELVSKIEKIRNVNFLVSKVDLSTSNMKSLCFAFNQKVENLFLVLFSESSNISVVCYISKSLVENKKLDASNVIKSICKEIDGAGGGQPFFAAGSGKNKVSTEKIIELSKNFL